MPYQGGQYSNEEFEQIQDGLQRPFGEWNCRHSWHGIILGVSPPTYTPEQLDQMQRYSTEMITIDGRTKTRYQWSQEMRRLETAIRQQKDTATLARYSGDDKLRQRCQGTILQLNRKYGQLADKAGLTPEYQRTYVQGFRDGKNKDGLTGTGTSITIPIGYKRELRTAQSIEDIKIPMTVDSVQNVMRNIGDRASYYRNVEIRVDADPMLIPHGILGWTSPDGKEVVFYANAFVNVENLAVTIAHESKHLQQVAETGIATTSEQLIRREHEAYNFEDEWWMENGERIMKAYEGTDWL